MAPSRSLLLVDDEPSLSPSLSRVLGEHGYEVWSVTGGEQALQELSARAHDVLLCDVRLTRPEELDVLREALAWRPGLTVVVMGGPGSQQRALEALEAGASDYIPRPFTPEELLFVLRKLEARERRPRPDRRATGAPGPVSADGLLGESAPMRELRSQLERLAPVSTTVLITGESGTGKELVARALHAHSARAHGPFVAVNCGALSAGLLESELFGHVRGAFTDARADRRGLFAEAHGGTLFLDEVGELPAAAQVKLLRVLQEGELRPVGESRAERVDVRLLAATLRDLRELVERGAFREDLYYRLNVVNVRLPPLRERSEDILLLARAFLSRFNQELARRSPVLGLSPEVEALLLAHPWPGNVRELENAMERAVLLAEGAWLLPQNLPERLQSPTSQVSPPAPLPTQPSAETNLSLKQAMSELERTFIRAALRRTRGNRTRAAEVLEISARALLYKIKEYGIDADAEGGRG